MPDRVVRVLPDVPAIDKVFDYTVPPAMDADVRVGTLARIALHGGRVGGWVVGEGGSTTDGRALKPIAKVTGWGPPPDVLALADWAAGPWAGRRPTPPARLAAGGAPPPAVLALADWAAWRWAGRRASLLGTASPPHAVRGLPPTRSASGSPSVGRTSRHRTANVRMAPAVDAFPLVLDAAREGPALILTPSVSEAAVIGRRLRAEGVPVAVHPREWALARAGGVSVVGARAAAWAAMPELASVVVLDAHDESYQEERAPTWHARDVAAERARRARGRGGPVWAGPDLAMLHQWGAPEPPDRSAERSGWPVLDVIDRRQDDPRTGLFSERLADAVRRH